eukprot:UN3853
MILFDDADLAITPQLILQSACSLRGVLVRSGSAPVVWSWLRLGSLGKRGLGTGLQVPSYSGSRRRSSVQAQLRR